MPTPRDHRRHHRSTVKPDRVRALELLAGWGAEGLMLAHGLTIPDMIELVRSGHATATAERAVAGRSKFEVARVRITDARRRALKGALS